MAPLFDATCEMIEQDERKILEWARTYRQNWTDREWARQEVLQGIDLEAQLLAIKSLLSRNRQAEDDLKREIDDLYKQSQQADQEAQGRYERYGDDRWVGRTYEALFEDAANSMAAVGMLAPFLEALFVTVFQRFKEEGIYEPPSEDLRRRAVEPYFWDPHFVDKRQKNLSKGILRLANSIGLEQFLPKDYRETLAALFLYRNKMFHCGFEWPEQERKNFRDAIKKNRWPAEWFLEATVKEKPEKPEKPWLFSMSAEFIQHGLQTIDGILDGVGAYVRSRWTEK